MSSTLLRLGLWIILIVIAAYVLKQTYEGAPLAEYIADSMLQKALALGGILVVVGIVVRLFEKGARVVAKNRCVVCGTTVPKGAIYCRAHLRRVLHTEEDKTHMRRPR